MSADNGYVKKRRGVMEHYKNLTLAEIAVFDVLIMSANYKKEPLHVAETSLRKLAKIVGCSVGTIHKATRGLEAMRYINRHEGGWEVFNLNGHKPVEHPDMGVEGVSKTDTPSNKQVYQKTTQGVSKTDTPLYQKLTQGVSKTVTPTPPKPKKTKAPKAPKKEKNVERMEEGTIRQCIKWNGKTFEGERGRVKELLMSRYSEFGEKWIQAEWKAIIEWAEDHPDEMKKTKSHYLFVLTWYRNAAKRKREWAK